MPKSELVRSIELTVVIPVTLMAGKLSKLEHWLHIAIKYPIQVLIIHDKRDLATSEQLTNLVHRLNTDCIDIVEGSYGDPGTARNQGIARAQGKWIAFWDSDDSPCVASVMSEIENTPDSIEVIVGSFRVVDEYKGIISNWRRPQNLRDIAMNPGVWRMIFRTASIENSRFPALLMAEDQVLLSKIQFAEKRIRFTSSEFYTYYVGNPTQLTKSRAALTDLPRAMLEIGMREFRVSHLQSKFDMYLIARQLVTSLRKAGMETKYAAIVAILRITKGNTSISILYLLQSLIYISSEKARLKKYEKSKFISLTGGLGNQLFQYAAALYESNGFEVSLVSSLGIPRTSQSGKAEIYSFGIKEPEITAKANWLTRRVAGYLLRQGLYRRRLERLRIFRAATFLAGRTLLSLHFRQRIHLIIGKGVGFSELRQSNGSQLLIGYFQSFRWASAPQVLEKLQSLELTVDSMKFQQYCDLAIVEKPLVVHVRLGDYKNEDDFGILTRTYYTTAIQNQVESKKYGSIWLFSDELEEAQQLLPKDLNMEIRLIHEVEASAAATLQVMRLGHGFVIANSTFSWWGAFLSFSEGAKVIAPSPWFRNSPEPLQLIPPHWTRCDAGW
jgi:glycosyltransferase involved in cell wall biosynthesis